MFRIFLLCSCVFFTGLPSLVSELTNSDYAAAQQVIHDISKFDSSFQDRARAIVEEKMSRYPEETYLRWRPVQIDPDDVLREHYLEPDAMPASLWLSPFSDVNLFAKRREYTPLRYSKFDYANSAIWEGHIDGDENTSVRITVVGSEDGPGFVIEISDPPRKYSVRPTDERDVYVAIEQRMHTDATTIQ